MRSKKERMKERLQAREKVLSEEDLISWRQYCAQKGERVVLTNGCFDLLHVGHLRCLEYAQSLGDHLVVAVNADSSVKALKGEGRPLISELERAELIAGLACVDRVVLFPDVRLTKIIERLSPDLYAKGGDYNLETMDQGERKALEGCGAEIAFFDIIADCSTTNILEKIQRTI